MKKGYSRIACVLTILISILWLSPASHAEIVVIENEVEEIVGKNQSQEQVEAFALQKAKRLAVEKAGTYISSLTTIQDHQLTKDEVTAIASGIVKAEIVGIPSIIVKNNAVYVCVKSRIQVDTSILDRQVEELLKDRNALKELEKERLRVKDLEKKLANLKSTELKRLEELNQQAIQIEIEREKQRLFREEQRLKAQEDIAQTELELLKQEKERSERFAKLQKKQEEARKKELELLEREQDRVKKAQMENDRYWKELSRKAENSQATWRPLDDTLSLKQAVEEAINLRAEIKNIKQRINLQFKASKSNLNNAYDNQFRLTKAILPPKPSPKDAFETTEEYTERINTYKQQVTKSKVEADKKIKKLKYEKDIELSKINVTALEEELRVLKPFINRLEELQNLNFAVPGEMAIIELGPPDPDNSRFPLKIKYKQQSWDKYWTYEDRNTALIFWKTKNHIKTQCLFRLVGTSDNSVSSKFASVKVSHLGTEQERNFNLVDITKFNEIDDFNNILNNELPKAKAEVEYFAIAPERDKLYGVWKRNDGAYLVIENNSGFYCFFDCNYEGDFDNLFDKAAFKNLEFKGEGFWSCSAFIWKKFGTWRYDYRSDLHLKYGRLEQVIYTKEKNKERYYKTAGTYNSDIESYYYKVADTYNPDFVAPLQGDWLDKKGRISKVRGKEIYLFSKDGRKFREQATYKNIKYVADNIWTCQYYQKMGSYSNNYRIELKDNIFNIKKIPGRGEGMNWSRVQKDNNTKKIISPTKTSNFSSKDIKAIQKGPKYYIRIHNIDDVGRAYLNGDLIETVKYKGDSGWINITSKLAKGKNQIKFALENGPNEWTYGFQVKKDKKVIWEDQCGNVIRGSGCSNSAKRGIVYGKSLTFKY